MPWRDRERGQILVLVAIGGTVLMLLLALVIDGGFAWERRREAQNAADFAALAGTRIVAQAQAGAVRTNQDVYGAISGSAIANGATVLGLGSASGALYVDATGLPIGGATGYVTNTATPIPSSARGVQVPAARTWTPYLLGIIGGGRWAATAVATARQITSAWAPCAFCVIGLNPPTPPFSMQSGAQVTANNGAIAVDPGLDMQGGPSLVSTGTGAAVEVYGTASVCGNCTVQPSLTTLSAPVPDPLAFLVDPPAQSGGSTVAVKGPKTVQTLNPGVYSSLTIEANATAQLNPGVYYFTGDVQIASNGTLSGTNVTLVFLPMANLHTQSNSNLSLVAPSPTDVTVPWPGMAIYFSRANTQGTLQLQSSSTTQITGTIYAPDALLDMQSGTTVASIHSLVVVGRSTMQANSKLTVTYDSSQNVQIPGAAGLVQ